MIDLHCSDGTLRLKVGGKRPPGNAPRANVNASRINWRRAPVCACFPPHPKQRLDLGR
jgi:hypothetical protein